MPIFIPLLIGAISAASAAHGIKKGIEGANDLSVAKERRNKAEMLSESAKANMENANYRAMDRLEKLADAKIHILSESMSDFVTNFERIKNVNFKETEGINELKNFSEYTQEIFEIKEATIAMKDIAMGGAASVAIGTLISKGTQAAVLGMVTKGGLAGAAASKHALALLGGGAKTVGGLGMAGGAAVLKGLNIGSAISLAGSIFASQAKKKYNEAESEYLQAEALNEQATNTCIVLNGIMVRASQLRGVLQILNRYFVDAVNNMCDIIRNCGEDYSKYNNVDKKSIYACAQLAITIKAIIDTTLLNADGDLEKQSLESLKLGQEYIAQLEAM